MSSELEIFRLPSGEEVATGLERPTPEALAATEQYPVYGEEFYLDKEDIKKSLQNDTYKTFRRLRQNWVLNQANLGKCNASATVNATHNCRGLDGRPHVVLSDCYVYMNINGGQDRGSLLVDGMALAQKGIAPRKLTVAGQQVLFPTNVYNKRQVSPALLQAATEAAAEYVAFEPYRIPSKDRKTFGIAVASALAQDHQIIHAWHVSNASMRLTGRGYIQQGRGPGNHATLAHSGKWVDGEDLVHPDIENSWGPTADPMYGPLGGGWGEGGFGLMTMDDFFQCAQYHQFWALPGLRRKGIVK